MCPTVEEAVTHKQACSQPAPSRTPHVNFDRRAQLVLALSLSTFGLLLLSSTYRWQPALFADERSLRALHDQAVQHPAFVTAMKVLSAAGSWPVYSLIFAGMATRLLLTRRPRLAMFVAVTPLTSSGLNTLTKTVVGRPRPQLPNSVASASGLSFPSGHAQAAMVTALILSIVLLPACQGRSRQVAMSLAVGFVLAVGLSRVALGVHYVTDVLAGFALGAAWVVLLSTLLLSRVQPRATSEPRHRRTPPGPPSQKR
jgi:membrane-associated phospholipid phosphatase